MSDLPDLNKIAHLWKKLYKEPITLSEARKIQEIWKEPGEQR